MADHPLTRDLAAIEPSLNRGDDKNSDKLIASLKYILVDKFEEATDEVFAYLNYLCEKTQIRTLTDNDLGVVGFFRMLEKIPYFRYGYGVLDIPQILIEHYGTTDIKFNSREILKYLQDHYQINF